MYSLFYIYVLLKAFLPNGIKFDDPTVIYSLANPIRSQKITFTKLTCNINIKTFPQDNSILQCNCEGFDFIGKVLQHIVTAALWIIKTNKLRKFFTKGPKHRQNNKIFG